MKKVFSIIALGTMTLSLSSFTNQSEILEYNSCLDEAIAYDEFMDGYNGLTAGGHAFDYARTFCN